MRLISNFENLHGWYDHKVFNSKNNNLVYIKLCEALRLGFNEKRSFGLAVVYRLNASRIICKLLTLFSENYDVQPVNKRDISPTFWTVYRYKR